VQPTTDGHRAYLHAVEDVFGTEIDFAMLQKIYGNAEQGPETRYSPAICMGARKAVITGNPDHAHISTSYVERQNLKMRMSMALHYMYYNFARIHQSLRVTPAMETGVSDHVWSLEIIELL